ncbi:sensor histidine kinase [Paenibacillus alba]|uniref:cache domain-containing sensor histidine kinase n=1 Tax=Paenibacillus alba TaxID=1197127 RepID=UPI0015665BE9|nr:sensor histidine kinase [Paenibacillus alba]NQX66979.1 sensor histidine kinase [Paenibacillus alba]
MIKWITSSIRKKLIVSFTSVILLPLILSIYLSYQNFARELERSYITDNTVILNQLNNRMNDYFKQLENIGFTFYSDLLFSQEYQLANNEFIQHNLKLKKLMSIYLGSKETNSVLFYTPSTQEVYVINKALNTSFSNAAFIEDKVWFKNALQSKGDLELEPSHRLQGYPADYRINANANVFSLSRTITGYTTEIGVLTINYEMDQLRKISGEGIMNPDEEVTLLNSQGELIYSSNPDFTKSDDDLLSRIQSYPQASGAFEYKEAGSRSTKLLVYTKSDQNGNILCKFIPLQIILAQAEKTRTINLLLGLMIIVIIIATTMYISFRLTKPLLKLKRFMVRTGEGNFQIHIPVTQTDEIGQISNAYNKMIQQIDTLITERYRMKLANQESQWRALQAQINPHFMYNTLQTIGSVALDEGIDEVEKMTHALSDMLRYSIKAGGKTTIQDEIRNVQDYLYIQKCRFEERLEYQIEVPETIGHLQVPKLLLQPLVENAIMHGTEPMKYTGKISIQCELEQGYLQIRIRDNGLGIEPVRLKEIQNNLASPDVIENDERDSIGIVNVMQRLRLMFGGQCRMIIDSRPYEGTKVEIWIPI